MDWDSVSASDWLAGQVTASEVQDLIAFLKAQGTFEFPALPNGLFSAAAGDGGDFELTGYRYVWLRDNIQIASAFLAVDSDVPAAVSCVRSLLRFYEIHRHRFVDIVEGRADHRNPMNRPHIRFDGRDLSELTEKWAHAQNDALGYFLWLTCELVRREHLSAKLVDWDVVALLVHFWVAVEVWQDEDSGHWEEVRKVAASSIGCVLAGLTKLQGLMQSEEILRRLSTAAHPVHPDRIEELMTKCRDALRMILPSECVQPDTEKKRRYDAALLFLIYPLNVIQDRVLEDQILSDVHSQLQGPFGIRRYPGDSYWCADYRTLLAADVRTQDFSDDLASRDQLLKPGMEAQWCIFDPIVSCIYGRRFQQDGDRSDLQRQIVAVRRSLAQLTTKHCRFPAYRCPESWFCEKGQWIPNDITPLLWTQANLLQALTLLQRSLATA